MLDATDCVVLEANVKKEASELVGLSEGAVDSPSKAVSILSASLDATARIISDALRMDSLSKWARVFFSSYVGSSVCATAAAAR